MTPVTDSDVKSTCFLTTHFNSATHKWLPILRSDSMKGHENKKWKIPIPYHFPLLIKRMSHCKSKEDIKILRSQTLDIHLMRLVDI